MAPEDRDPIFEKALARHLRAKLSSPGAPREGEEPAGAPGASAGHAPEFSASEFSADAACPNPEVLAAYHERLLVPEEMANLKGHIAACDRCQEILATLEATDDLLLPSDRTASDHHNVVTMPAPHVEIPAEIVAAAARAPLSVSSRSARRAQSSWRSKTLRGANWKWLAPAGAIAAILLLWVGFHESHPSTFELAKNTQPAAAPPATRIESAAVTSAPQSNELADHAKSQPSATPHSQADAFARDETKKRDQVFLDEKKSVDRAIAKPVVPQVTTTAPAAPQFDRDPRESGLTVPYRNDAPPETKESAAPAPPPGSSAGQPVRGYAGSAQKQDKDASVGVQSEVAAPSKSESAAKAKTAGGRQAPEQDNQRAASNVLSLQTQTTETVTSNKNGAMLRVAKMSSANVIAAPNNAALWRASPAGIIERSTDRGATWEVQSSGVVSDLLTGSAPTADVCWIVGRNGTILRTTDAGAHWEKLNAPATEDLTSIFAVSAQQATVSTTTPPRSYRTTDAGKTWTQFPTP
jgi:hypothetical protein